jgi:hypothetical protein
MLVAEFGIYYDVVAILLSTWPGPAFPRKIWL